MFRCRMASWPFSFVPIWLIFCVTAVLATNLPNDFSRLIPSCAEECFASFLNVNYVLDSCTGRPLLDCLCSRRGASGFTLGEGAMQCISAERSIGFCSILEANGKLYNNTKCVEIELLTQNQIESSRMHMTCAAGSLMLYTLPISPSQQLWFWPPQEGELLPFLR
jgi:hypothetical protein